MPDEPFATAASIPYEGTDCTPDEAVEAVRTVRATAATEPVHVNLAGRWRTGRKVGRTIYAQQGPEPSDDDPLIGVMDLPALAALAVKDHNRSLDHAD